MSGPDAIRVREATSRDRSDVLNVLNGAGLETDWRVITDALARGDAFVAVASPEESSASSEQETARGEGDRVLGALVLDGREILAVAVRRRRRGQGIGTALVDAAGQGRDRLVADFDGRVRPFWASLGFEISPTEDGRYLGVE